MANGDDKAQLSSLMDSTAMGPEINEEEMELDIEVAAPGTFVGSVNEILPEGIEIEPEEDGGVTIDFDPMAMVGLDDGDFYRNLAEELDDRELGRLSSELLASLTPTKRRVPSGKTRIPRALELWDTTMKTAQCLSGALRA